MVIDCGIDVPFDAAATAAPRVPGVYLARQAAGDLVYVGMAGERRGQGVRARLTGLPERKGRGQRSR